MHKREMVLALLALGAAPFASAQQTAKIPRIAVFSVTPLSAQAPWLEALRQGRRELGYVEGKNIVIEYRSAEGKLERTQEIAAELVPPTCWRLRELYPASQAAWRIPTLLFTGLGMALGGWLAGAIYDRFGSYTPAFAAGVGANALNLLLIGTLLARRRYRRASRKCRTREVPRSLRLYPRVLGPVAEDRHPVLVAFAQLLRRAGAGVMPAF